MVSIKGDDVENSVSLLQPSSRYCNVAAKNKPKFWFSRRFFIAIFIFFETLHIISMKGNLNLAIVAMTSSRKITMQNETIIEEAEFNWDSKTKGFIISIYICGFTLAIFGSQLSMKFGGSTMAGIATLAFACTTLLIPTIVRYNFYLFIMVRVLEGVFEGIQFVSLNELWAQWTPSKDRSKLMSIGYCGVYIGYSVVYPICGFFIHKFRWPAAFYVTGTASLFWCFLWFTFVPNNPTSDKWITEDELAYIEENKIQGNRPKHIKSVLKSIFTSKCIWALWICKLTFQGGSTLVVTCIPMYIKDVLNVGIDKIGIFSAVPSILCTFIVPLLGYVADLIQNRKILTPTQVHKTFICTGHTIGAVSLLCIGFFHISFINTMLCFVAFKLVLSFSFVILLMSCVCMAPQCASLVAGSLAVFQSLGFALAPMLIGFIVTNHSPEEWSLCISIIGISLLLGAIMFLFCGSGDAQLWSYSIEDKEQESTKCDQVENE